MLDNLFSSPQLFTYRGCLLKMSGLIRCFENNWCLVMSAPWLRNSLPHDVKSAHLLFLKSAVWRSVWVSCCLWHNQALSHGLPMYLICHINKWCKAVNYPALTMLVQNNHKNTAPLAAFVTQGENDAPTLTDHWMNEWICSSGHKAEGHTAVIQRGIQSTWPNTATKTTKEEGACLKSFKRNIDSDDIVSLCHEASGWLL